MEIECKYIMRDPVIGMMKGVGILFVLIGHTAIPSDYLKNFIYFLIINFIFSVHMTSGFAS